MMLFQKFLIILVLNFYIIHKQFYIKHYTIFLYNASFTLYRSSHPEVFCKKDVLRNFAKFTEKHLCQRLFFNKVAGLRPQACKFPKKESLAQVFSCEVCEISKYTSFYRTPLAAASAIWTLIVELQYISIKCINELIN